MSALPTATMRFLRNDRVFNQGSSKGGPGGGCRQDLQRVLDAPWRRLSLVGLLASRARRRFTGQPSRYHAKEPHNQSSHARCIGFFLGRNPRRPGQSDVPLRRPTVAAGKLNRTALPCGAVVSTNRCQAHGAARRPAGLNRMQPLSGPGFTKRMCRGAAGVKRTSAIEPVNQHCVQHLA